MREAIMSPSNAPARLSMLGHEQIAARRTWSRVPDTDTALAAMHVLHVRPLNGSTVTELNPLDVGTVADMPADGERDLGGPGWLDMPHAFGSLFGAGK